MIRVQALAGGAAEILIYEQIGLDWFGSGLTAQKFREDLARLGEVDELTVRINSPGGEVFDGFAIYNALKEHPAKIHVAVDGVAASIASVIAMAGDEISMGVGAMLMIHDPATLAYGDAEDMRAAAAMLDQVGAGLVDAYVARTGKSRAQVEQWMAAETWFTAAEAVDEGFADTLASAHSESSLSPAASAMLARFHRVPTEVYAMLKRPTGDSIAGAEHARQRSIREVFGHHAGAYRELLDELLGNPAVTTDGARKRLLDRLGEMGSPLRGLSVPPVQDDFRLGAVDALLQRAGIRLVQPHPAAQDLRRTRLVDLAKTCLSQAGRSHSSLDNLGVIRAAMSTSDFPAILENVTTKAMRNGFEADPASHRAWVRSSTADDFKVQSRVLLGSAPNLNLVVEGGEYEFGSMLDDKASFVVAKFGRLIRFTWEALVNDDLSAFSIVPRALGQAARRAEADTVYALLTTAANLGQTMQDGIALFNAAHANLVSPNVTLFDVAALDAGRVLLRRQTTLGGSRMNVVPRFLIVSPERETAAEVLIASATLHRTAAGGDVDAFASNTQTLTPAWMASLQLVVEPRLDSTGFYLAGSTDQVDTCEVAVLSVDGGPIVEDQPEFERDARTYKVRHVFGARFLDWRGIVRVPFAAP